MHDRRQTITIAAALSGAEWPLPDRDCVATGDRYLNWAIRSFAAGGLSNEGISRRVADQVEPPPVHLSDVLWSIAWHCAAGGLPFHQIIAVLVYLADEVPGCPDDPEELATISRWAIRETAS
jgi:hypothetical protein